MMNTILPLLPTDLTEAWHIEQASHAFPWSAKTFAGNQGERYLNFKLCVGDRIVAFAITQIVLDKASLFNIAVHPDFQRQGRGRALLDYLITELEQRQVLTFWLEVRQSNATAITLYRALGFNEVSIRRHYYPSEDGREDAIIMALPLGDSAVCQGATMPTRHHVESATSKPFNKHCGERLSRAHRESEHEERPLRRRNCVKAQLRDYFAP